MGDNWPKHVTVAGLLVRKDEGAVGDDTILSPTALCSVVYRIDRRRNNAVLYRETGRSI